MGQYGELFGAFPKSKIVRERDPSLNLRLWQKERRGEKKRGGKMEKIKKLDNIDQEKSDISFFPLNK